MKRVNNFYTPRCCKQFNLYIQCIETYRSFTVAKVTRVDLLKDIFDSLLQAQREGKSFQSWKKDLTPTLKSYGWWGEVEVKNPDTGEVKDIYVGSSRLRTIFETNMRVSYSVARYEQMQELPTSFGYWRYVSAMLERSRASHKAMHGKVFPKNHSFWDKNYPPNAWNCKCKVQAFTKRQIEKRGWNIEEKADNIASKDWAYNVGKIDKLDKIFKQKVDRIKSPELKALAVQDYEGIFKKEMPKDFKNLTSDERRFIFAWVDNASTTPNKLSDIITS